MIFLRFLALTACLTFACLTTAYAVDSPAFELVKQDMAAGHYEKALQKLEPLVKAEDSNYEAWFLYGVAHVHAQQFHQAIEAFRHVIDLHPILAEPHNNIAAIYNALGDTPAAIAELKEALKKRPNYVVAEENLADLYVKLALQHYRNTLNQVENPIVEQRYNRLLSVRNPMIMEAENKTGLDASNTLSPISKQPAAVRKASPPVMAPTPTAPTTTMPVLTIEKPAAAISQPLPAMPAEGRTIAGVLDALEAWRMAWSNQNINGYFAAYDNDYQPEARFSSRQLWKDYKKKIIASKTYIRVTLNDVNVSIDKDSVFATVDFMQSFRSNNYNNDSNKRITFRFGNAGWKIFAEESIE